MVTLPDGVDACDIGTITIWCEPFTAFFSRLEVPRNVFVSIERWGLQRASSYLVNAEYYFYVCIFLIPYRSIMETILVPLL